MSSMESSLARSARVPGCPGATSSTEPIPGRNPGPWKQPGPTASCRSPSSIRGRGSRSIATGNSPRTTRPIEPHVFEPPLRVAIGVRHLAPFGLPPSRFAGKIEEARIYDRALSGDEIATMKPGTPSSIKPLAQWSFEDGTARDEMGFFPQCTLHGGAHVADGKLHLDGTDDYLSTGADDFTSLVPRRESYAGTLPEQLDQLQDRPAGAPLRRVAQEAGR